jgi:hypothetical protein
VADTFQLESSRIHVLVTLDGRIILEQSRIHGLFTMGSGFRLEQSRIFALFEGPLVATGFPTQYAGLKGQTSSSTVDLCLVAAADAPTGMGGALFVQKGGTTYAVYLVDTSDPNASPFRVRTTAGTKSIRLKT